MEISHRWKEKENYRKYSREGRVYWNGENWASSVLKPRWESKMQVQRNQNFEGKSSEEWNFSSNGLCRNLHV